MTKPYSKIEQTIEKYKSIKQLGEIQRNLYYTYHSSRDIRSTFGFFRCTTLLIVDTIFLTFCQKA